MNQFRSPHFRPGQKIYVQGREVTKDTADREALLAESIQLMREFCAKVEAGKIHSVNTYRKMKDILRRYDQ